MRRQPLLQRSLTRGLKVIALRILLAAALSLMINTLGASGMYVTTAPEWVSLLVEPLSLLLTPGLVVALIIAGAHDFSPLVAIRASLALYFLFIYLALHLRQMRKRRALVRV